MSEVDLERLRSLSGALADALERQAALGQRRVPLAGAAACAAAIDRLVEVPKSGGNVRGASKPEAPSSASGVEVGDQASERPTGLPPWSRSRRSAADEVLRARRPEQVQAELAKLEEGVQACTACPRHAKRVGCVRSWGVGVAKLLVLGLPGSTVGPRFGGWMQEDEGALLERMLKAMSLSIPEVHTATMARCILPDEEAATDGAWEACRTWLEKELVWTRAPWVLVVGEDAADMLARSTSAERPSEGTLARWNDRRWLWIRHPAELLAKPETKRVAWQGMQRLMEAMRLGEEAS